MLLLAVSNRFASDLLVVFLRETGGRLRAVGLGQGRHQGCPCLSAPLPPPARLHGEALLCLCRRDYRVDLVSDPTAGSFPCAQGVRLQLNRKQACDRTTGLMMPPGRKAAHLGGGLLEVGWRL